MRYTNIPPQAKQMYTTIIFRKTYVNYVHEHGYRNLVAEYKK